jgi:hypothetical protein
VVPELQRSRLPEGVAQVFNLRCDRIYLRRLASPIAQQNAINAILRYIEICATFRVGPRKEHPRNRGNPRLISAFASGCAKLGFRVFLASQSKTMPAGRFIDNPLFRSIPGGGPAACGVLPKGHAIAADLRKVSPPEQG